MFSDEEVHAAWQMTRDASNDDVRAVMAFTANLLAARSGTMTADEVRMRLARISAHNADDASALRGHFNEIGARNAVLEAEVARLTQHVERVTKERDAHDAERNAAAQEMEIMRAWVWGGAVLAQASVEDSGRVTRAAMQGMDEREVRIANADRERDELKTSRDRLRREAQELATLRDQMEREAELWRMRAAEYDTERNEAWAAYRKQDARANEAEDEVDRVSTERDALKARVSELEERCARLSVAGQALSEHADKTAGGPLTAEEAARNAHGHSGATP